MKMAMDLDRILRRANRMLGLFAGGLIVIATVLVSYDVVMRYAFSDASLWISDAARYMMVYVFFFGLPIAQQDGAHVSVDLFLGAFGEQSQWVLRILGDMLLLVFAGVLTWQTTAVTLDSIRMEWLSPTYLAVPLKIVYVAGPLGSVFFVLAVISGLARRVVVGPSKRAPASQPET